MAPDRIPENIDFAVLELLEAPADLWCSILGIGLVRSECRRLGNFEREGRFVAKRSDECQNS
jgi:hypothetical protein